jgi:hypothetical protein
VRAPPILVDTDRCPRLLGDLAWLTKSSARVGSSIPYSSSPLSTCTRSNAPVTERLGGFS